MLLPQIQATITKLGHKDPPTRPSYRVLTDRVKGHQKVNRGHLVKIYELVFLPYGTSYVHQTESQESWTQASQHIFRVWGQMSRRGHFMEKKF